MASLQILAELWREKTSFCISGSAACFLVYVIVQAVSSSIAPLTVNLHKSYLADGLPVANDCITLHGSPFSVKQPDAPQKHHMTVLGDFMQKMFMYVRRCMLMKWCIYSLLSHLILTPSMKEYAFKTRTVPVFQYSIGFVPWLLNELLETNIVCQCVEQCIY